MQTSAPDHIWNRDRDNGGPLKTLTETGKPINSANYRYFSQTPDGLLIKRSLIRYRRNTTSLSAGGKQMLKGLSLQQEDICLFTFLSCFVCENAICDERKRDGSWTNVKKICNYWLEKGPADTVEWFFFYPVGRESFYNLRVRVAIHMLNKFSVTSRWLTALVMRRDGGGNGASIKLCP